MPNVDTALLHAVGVLNEDDKVRRGEAVHTATFTPADSDAVPAGCYCVVTVQVRRLAGRADAVSWAVVPDAVPVLTG